METGGSTPNASADRNITFFASGAAETGRTIFSIWSIGYDTRVFSVTLLSSKSIFPSLSSVTFSRSASRLIAL